jgi:translation initiation factor IF-2
MAEIRLSKLTKQYNIGLGTLVEFLNQKGAQVEMNPNAKVSDEFIAALDAKFGDEKKAKEDSE